MSDKPITKDGEIVDEHSKEFADWMETEQSVTVGQVLFEAFPKLFIEELEDEGEIIVPSNNMLEVLTHGVKVDLNTSMYWMQLNLAYPDGFVYLSFHLNK